MNKGLVLISGGGDPDISYQIDSKFFSCLDKRDKILYIPVALNRSKSEFKNCFSWFCKLISIHAEDKGLEVTMLLEDDALPELDSFNAIYIGGGNTYKLLDYLKRKELDEKIIKYLEQGGIIYGGSAGAIVLGKYISTVKEENTANFQFEEGLNVLDNKSIYCHYEEKQSQKIVSISKELNTEVLALPEESGIIFNFKGGIKEVVGKVFVFDRNGNKQI